MDVINQVNGTLNKGLDIVSSNRIAGTVLGLFLALYAALAAPNLPASVTVIFKNTWFRLAFMFLIGYMATKDSAVAIITAVGLLVTLQTLSAQETTSSVVSAVEKKVQANIEKFASLNSNNEDDIDNFENVDDEDAEDAEDDVENFASIPAKSTEDYDDDVEDYSLYDSNKLIYSGGGLHSSPDNVTGDDVKAQTFNVRSPAFASDERSIASDQLIFEQQVEGDTYYQVGMEMDNQDASNYDNKKIQELPYVKQNVVGDNLEAIESKPEAVDYSVPISSEKTFINDKLPPASTVLSLASKVKKVNKKKIPAGYEAGENASLLPNATKEVKHNKKNSKKSSVQGFSNSTHFTLENEDEEEEVVENSCGSDNIKESFLNQEVIESSCSANIRESFLDQNEYSGSCGADPAETVPGFDVTEFASF